MFAAVRVGTRIPVWLVVLARGLQWLALAFALFAGCAVAGEPTFIDNEGPFAVVADVTEPLWPRNAPDPAYVDIVGKLTPLGELHDESITPDRPENAAFAEAVRAVLPKWKFRTPQDRDCAPTRDPIHVRVLFELDNGRQRMRITHMEVTSSTDKMKSIDRKEPLFPRSMLRAGIGARVYTRVEVKPDGSVSAVRVRAFSSSVDPKSDVLLPFEIEATRALREWKFAPAPEGADRIRIACYTLDFNIH